MLALQIIALLVGAGLTGHLAARAWDRFVVDVAPRRTSAATVAARRAIRQRRLTG